jgi:hypothetical protein
VDTTTRDLLERCAELAIGGIQREFPYHLTHVFSDRREIEAPRQIFPVFYGCFDWHSAVHGHWLLARVTRLQGACSVGSRCRELLNQQLVEGPLQIEAQLVAGHPSFERPYGLVWVLALAAELRQIDDAQGRRWHAAVAPLEEAALANLLDWLPKLSHPMRTGTHNQTAFALALMLDWAGGTGNREVGTYLVQRARDYFGEDRDYAVDLEPGGEDFLSPSLGAAWLMSRVLSQPAFTVWLDHAMPRFGRGFDFLPATVRDHRDGRLAHLDGLNISMGWMLTRIMDALPPEDDRREAIVRMAKPIVDGGFASIESQEYAGTHWLGTFAAYALGPEVDP